MMVGMLMPTISPTQFTVTIITTLIFHLHRRMFNLIMVMQPVVDAVQ
jgi:hypothetical protein